MNKLKKVATGTVFSCAYSTGRKSSQKMNLFPVEVMLRKLPQAEPNAGLWRTCFDPKRSSKGYRSVLFPQLDGPMRKGTRFVFLGPNLIMSRRAAASFDCETLLLFASNMAFAALQ